MFRSISTGFWTDTKVFEDFTPEDKYFYLYLFTNSQTNLAGCYEISIKQIVIETGYSRETIENLIKRFVEVHDVIRYDAITNEILLLNWHKHNWTKSDKYRKGLEKHIKAVKSSHFKAYLLEVFERGVENEEESDTVSIPYPYPTDTANTLSIPISNTISNTNNKNKRSKPERNQIPPTKEMVQAYISAQGYEVDASQFMDFYESKGWLVGKSKMKDWQAAVRSWNSRQTKPKIATNPFTEMLRTGDYQ